MLNHILKLKKIPKIKLFAGKFIRGKIFTRGNLRSIGIDINVDFLFVKIRWKTLIIFL